MANNFLVSVGNAVGRDASNGNAIFLGKANISSGVTVSTTAQEVRGGIGNGLLYIYYHSRKFDCKIQAATFDKQYLGMNVGSLSQTSMVTAVQTENITLVSGVGTTTLVPTSDICVFLSDGSTQTITPTYKSFTVTNGAAQTVAAVYNYSILAENITVDYVTPPKLIDLTITAELRDDTNSIVSYVQIRVPRYQVAGNYTLNLAANGVATTDLDGMGIEYTDPVDNSKYVAKVIYIPATSSAIATSAIAAVPSALLFTTAGGIQSVTKVVAVRGISVVDVLTSCSFTCAPATAASFVAGLHTGLVTISASAAATHPSTSSSLVITWWDSVSSASLTDWVNLIVQ